MIRHRPFGSGHPYSVDTEQRHPVDPVAGEPVTLGVRTSGAVDGVTLEYSVDGVVGTKQLSPARLSGIEAVTSAIPIIDLPIPGADSDPSR